MISVSHEEVLEFIFKQPRDRKINWEENYSTQSCGCIMVQYCKEILHYNDFICLVYGVSSSNVFGNLKCSFEKTYHAYERGNTYGELQDYFREEYDSLHSQCLAE